MDTKEIEILHLSARPNFKGGSGFQKYNGNLFDSPYVSVNVVFRCHDEYAKQWAKKESEEYRKLFVTKSPELAEKYYSGLTTRFLKPEGDQLFGKMVFENSDNIKHSDVYFEAYEHNAYTMLQYIEKFDVYTYKEHIEWGPAVSGLLQELENIRNGCSTSMNSDSGNFSRVIKALDLFWH
jgi:hypothetical protein